MGTRNIDSNRQAPNKQVHSKQIKRGDLLYVNLDPAIGSEQGDVRPAVVVQNNAGNKHSPTIIIVPITCNLNKNPLPTHKVISKRFGLDVDSLALTEQIRTIDRSRILRYIGKLDENTQTDIDIALGVSLGLLLDMEFQIGPESPTSLGVSGKTRVSAKHQKHVSESKLFDLCLCRCCESDFIGSGYRLVKKGFAKVLYECDYCNTGRGFGFRVFRVMARLPERCKSFSVMNNGLTFV